MMLFIFTRTYMLPTCPITVVKETKRREVQLQCGPKSLGSFYECFIIPHAVTSSGYIQHFTLPSLLYHTQRLLCFCDDSCSLCDIPTLRHPLPHTLLYFIVLCTVSLLRWVLRLSIYTKKNLLNSFYQAVSSSWHLVRSSVWKKL